MKTILIFDGSNIAHRTFFAHQANPRDSSEASGLALHFALNTFNKYYKMYQPTMTFVAFDRPNWRKQYTQSGECLTKAVYKANRRQNMTPAQVRMYEEFKTHLGELEDLFNNHTNIKVLAANLLEADDLIAGVCEMYPNDKIVIVSADGDYKQLLDNPNVRLVSPIEDKEQLCEDTSWFMFEKCIRGDVGDNVKSAFPRVRTTRLERAFADPLEYTLLMNETWTVDGTTYKVGDLYKENNLLMNLRAQPDHIKTLIRETIEVAVNKQAKFNNFQFLKFCGRKQLVRIVEQSHNYIGLLSGS